MSDESVRPTQGRYSGRHGSGAPAWWQHLDRTDLPDLERNTPRPVLDAWFSESVPPLVIEDEAVVAPAGRRQLRSWAVTVAVLLLAAAVALAGLGLGSLRGMVVALVVLGLPVLVCVLAAVATRRRAA